MLLLVSTGDDLDIHGDPETIWRHGWPVSCAAAPPTPGITRPRIARRGQRISRLDYRILPIKAAPPGSAEPGPAACEAGFAGARNGATCKGRDGGGAGDRLR